MHCLHLHRVWCCDHDSHTQTFIDTMDTWAIINQIWCIMNGMEGYLVPLRDGSMGESGKRSDTTDEVKRIMVRYDRIRRGTASYVDREREREGRRYERGAKKHLL